jgi:hypothetical protein
MKENVVKRIRPEMGFYLAGFVDGEGSFNVSLRKRNDHAMGWQVVLAFNVSQKDKTVLALLKKHLSCGTLWQRSDGVWYYNVHNPIAIYKNVLPFFDRFTFLSAVKKRNFSIFRKIAFMVMDNKHLTQYGLQEIVRLREKLNEGRGRKRKYSIHEYLESLLKNPQRLYARAFPRSKRPERHDIVRSHGRP